MEERIVELAKKLGVSVDSLKRAYQKRLELEPITRPDRELRALRRARGDIKRALKSVREFARFEGMLVGARDLIDRAELMRQRARREWEKDREKAIANGFCSEDGTPLFYMRVYGRDVIGKPIEGSLWERELFVICRKEGQEEFSFNSLLATGELAQRLELPPFFTPLKFGASIRKRGLGLLSITEFEKLDAEWNPEEIIKKALPCYKASEVESYLESRPEEQRREVISIEGILLTANLVRKVKYIDIDDEEMESYLRCFLRSNVEIKVGEDSKVLVIGTPSWSKRGPGVIVDCYGVYAPPEEAYPLPEEALGSLSREEETG